MQRFLITSIISSFLQSIQYFPILDPNLLNLYGVTQSLMEHLYWLYPDMEGMAAGGGGQMGQSEVDEETDPPTVKAKAMTFPLLIHESCSC